MGEIIAQHCRTGGRAAVHVKPTLNKTHIWEYRGTDRLVTGRPYERTRSIVCLRLCAGPNTEWVTINKNKLLVDTHTPPYWIEQQGETSNSFFPQDAKCSQLIVPEASRAGEPVIKMDIEGITALNVTHPFLLPVNVLSSRRQLELEFQCRLLSSLPLHPSNPRTFASHASQTSCCWCEQLHRVCVLVWNQLLVVCSACSLH